MYVHVYAFICVMFNLFLKYGSLYFLLWAAYFTDLAQNYQFIAIVYIALWSDVIKIKFLIW